MSNRISNNHLCLVCNGVNFKDYYSGIVQCQDCAFITADLHLTPEQQRQLYGHDYFHGGEYADYIRDRHVMDKNFRKRLQTVLGYAKDGRLLELGCAYGVFLHLAQRYFRVTGYDISEEAVRYANDVLGVDAHCGDVLADDNVRPASFDVVTMWDVIEHLRCPDLYIERVAKSLKKGGYLFLTTGDIDSVNARWRKRQWRLIHPPTHLHFFSKRTLTQLLERNGFRVVRTSYPGYYRSIDQILYSVLVLQKNNPSLYRLLSAVVPREATIYLNLFDIMCVVARLEEPQKERK